MLRLPCDILRKSTGDPLEVRILGFFSCSKPGIGDWIYFMIDTGAWNSLISQNDAKRLALDYSNLKLLPEDQWAVGIGGKCPLYRIDSKCTLSLGTRDSGKFAFQAVEEYDYFDVVKIPDEHKDKVEVSRLPSLLGIDTITRYKLSVSKSSAVLEK